MLPRRSSLWRDAVQEAPVLMVTDPDGRVGEMLTTDREVRSFAMPTNMVLIRFQSPSFAYVRSLFSAGVHLHLLFLDYEFSLWVGGLATGRNQIR